MSSTVKLKKANGVTYLYENTTVWDKEKKKYIYKRVAVGKITPDGEEIRYDEKPKVLLPPKFTKNFGNIYLLDEITKSLGLSDILKDIFFDEYDVFITLVHYIVCVDSSLSNVCDWMGLTDTLLKSELSSQYIYKFLKKINDEKILSFFKKWVNKRIEKEYIAFDITSISSYSELIDIVELGYNRDKEKLPQVNMGMFFGEESLLPIFYNIYPGSIKDVKTLKNMLTYCDVLGAKKIKFVMDKGFYSDANITDMIKEKKKFTIAIPFKSAIATSKVLAVKDIIKKPSRCLCNNELVYGVTIEDKWKYSGVNGEEMNSTVYYHIMYDDDKRNEIENRIMNKVQLLKEEFDGYIAEYKRLPKNIDKYVKYLDIKGTKKISCSIKDEVVENEMKNEGYMVVISNDQKNVKDVFNTYRKKDVVEKAFDNLKNDLDVKRLKVHSGNALKGKMFIAFIALILKTSIYNKTITNPNISKFSVNEILKEMQKLSLVSFSDEVSMLTEISSKQNKILKAFSVNAPQIRKEAQS